MRKLILASLTISVALLTARALEAQTNTRRHGSLQHRLDGMLDQPPFDRVTWKLYVADDQGRLLFQRDGDRLSVPASNTKLVVSATATVLLPTDYRVRTGVYVNGVVRDGIVYGDLILYGRGDPTFTEQCYSADTLAAGACDSTFTAMGALADSVRARGIRLVTGRIVGDGSYFEPTLIHPNWNAWDLNWWYAAPVSALGFHYNSVDFHITPGDSVNNPPKITWTPDLGLFSFENRARTGPADSGSTIGDNFFRHPGTMEIWAEGTAAQGSTPWIESFALPDPNLYAARAFAASLMRDGISVGGGAASTTDSLAYRSARCCGSPLFEYRGRPVGDIVFPILNASQNWFAEMLLKVLGHEFRGAGSWNAGLDVERRFLIDSVHVDSTAFSLEDGSGLAARNLVTPHGFVQLLTYMYRHPKRGPFIGALPRSGQPGTLQSRFVGTPFEGHVVAKTGSIGRVNTLSGYIERPDGHMRVFSIQANAHAVPGRQMLAQIDSLVVEIGKTR